MTTNNNATNGNDTKPWANEPMLSKPLYAFDLPKELLNNLRLRSIDIPTEADEDDGHSRRRVGEENEANQNDSGCAICPKAPHFRNIAEKRAHLRSDWHRYNVALNKKGRNEDAIALEAFTKIAEEVSSAEESETEPEGEINVRVPVDLVNTLLKRLQLTRSAQGQTDATSDEEGEEQEKGKNSVAREPHLWFHTPPSETAKAIPQTQFGIIRQLFPENDVDHSIKDWHSQVLSRMQPGPLQSSSMQGAKRLKGASAAEEAASILNVVFYDAPNRRQESDSEEESDYDDEEEEKEEGSNALSSSHSTSLAPQPMRTWTILLMGGGDFAALVVALNPYEQIVSKKKGTTERQLLVIARKQFHRYTTRRKQGGAQSAQDASGRFAKSAGAQLRRYGEQQLAEEIRDLLDRPEWRNAIQSSERVWIRAGLRSARGVLWSWPSSGGAVRESPLEEMRRKDLVQNLPIAVRKPTVGECLRCFAELTKVRIRHETEEEMQKRDEAYKAQLQGTAQARQERRQKQKERLQREAEMKQAASTKKRTPIKLDPVEQLRRERLIRLVDMLRKGRLNNSIKHLEKYELDLLHPNGWQNDAEANFDPDDVDESMELARQRINAELPEWWRFLDAREKGALLHGPADSIESQLSNLTIRNRLVPSTILQVAAEGGSESVVNHFLVERHCDPTLGIAAPPHSDIFDEDATKQEIAIKAKDKASTIFPHRTAYDLCPNRESRDVFRRLMGTRSDLCKDWSGTEKGGARVPKALTEEMEEARNKEEQVRDKRQLMRERARKRQEEEASMNAHTITEEDRIAAIANQRVKKDIDQQSSTSNTNRLGGSNSAPRALQKKMDESQGLTPEMRARIEREKRARAAEARLKGL